MNSPTPRRALHKAPTLLAGLLLATYAAAPSFAAEKKPTKPEAGRSHSHSHEKAEKAHAHAHEHHAPHKGTLVAFGEEFAHLELVLDQATGKLSAYALDGEAEKPVRLTQKEIVIDVTLPAKGKAKPATTETITLQPVASPLTGESAGDTSEFGAQSDKLKGQKKWTGAVKAITIRGTEFKDTAFKFPEGNE